VLVYTRIIGETAPESHVLKGANATVGDLLEKVSKARTSRGREITLLLEGAEPDALLADLGVADGSLLEVRASGSPVPSVKPADESTDVDFSSLVVAPVSAKKTTEYEAVTELLQWHAPFHIDGGRPSQTVWTAESTVLQSVDWEAYRSPDKLYYRTYMTRQSRNDRSVSTAFRYAEETGQLASVDAEHVETMRQFVGALQYPDWGLCMLHQHITRFCMSSWISGASSFMMFDQLRHAQLYGRLAIAYGEIYEGFDDPQRAWMDEPRMQPTRQIIEELLVELDWGKSFVIAGLLVEPLLTAASHSLIAGRRGRDGDTLAPFVCQSILEDKVRHRESVDAFVQLVAEDPENGDLNRGLITMWADEWLPRALDAALTLVGDDPNSQAAVQSAHAAVYDTIQTLRLGDAL
jgi:phenol hydroxylase P1 protein